MKDLEPRLSFEIVWKDESMLKVDVEASNSRYLGKSRIYMGRGLLKNFADVLARFPEIADDKRHFEFGNELALFALDFYCFDNACHSAVFIRIVDEDWDDDEHRSKASFELRIEPAAIDRFIAELKRIDAHESGSAVLASL